MMRSIRSNWLVICLAIACPNCWGPCSNCWGQGAAPEPLPQHKMLAREVGQWEGVMKMYAGGPDAPPIEMPVVETNTLMEGGLWVISEFETGPFKGRGQFGYDPEKKKFVGTWIDNQTMALGILEGTHNDTTGETTYLSTVKNPTTGKDVSTKQVGKIVDDNHKSFVAYMQADDGKNWDLWMEISYTRQK